MNRPRSTASAMIRYPAAEGSPGDAATLVRRDDEAQCDRCGNPSPYDFGDRRVCDECYAVCGSCCLEFGADDLWESDDEA